MEELYSEVTEAVEENKEYGDIVIIIGDYNAKVGEERNEGIVGLMVQEKEMAGEKTLWNSVKSRLL